MSNHDDGQGASGPVGYAKVRFPEGYAKVRVPEGGSVGGGGVQTGTGPLERQAGMARALAAGTERPVTSASSEPVTVGGARAHDPRTKRPHGLRGDPIDGWTHPGFHVPRTVLLVALGPSKQSLIELQTNHQPPTFGIDQVWGINAGVNWLSSRVSFDCLFVLDYLAGEAAKWPRYGTALREWAAHHDAVRDAIESRPDRRRIITTVAGEKWDSIAMEYPLPAVWQRAYDHAPCLPYLLNSIPMILLYAWAIGVEEVHLWGADYNHPQLGSFREPERANAEYWIGWVRGAGMRVVLPESTTLLGTADLMANWRVYGYPPGADRHPRLTSGMNRILMPGEDE